MQMPYGKRDVVKVELPDDPEDREEILQLPFEERVEYIPLLFDELFIDTWKQLKKWRDVTNQTAQPDAGYIAQHLVSVFSGIPGTLMRGKGDDLDDGSEVKTASEISGVDQPRWNHTISSEEKLEEWFNQPNVYYVLIDRNDNTLIRVRIWCVKPSEDPDYRELFKRWNSEGYSSSNLQMHPPIGKTTNEVRKDVGNIMLPLAFEMIIQEDEIEIQTAELDPGKSKLIQESLSDWKQ